MISKLVNYKHWLSHKDKGKTILALQVLECLKDLHLAYVNPETTAYSPWLWTVLYLPYKRPIKSVSCESPVSVSEYPVFTTSIKHGIFILMGKSQICFHVTDLRFVMNSDHKIWGLAFPLVQGRVTLFSRCMKTLTPPLAKAIRFHHLSNVFLPIS